MLYHFAITPDAFDPSAIPHGSREAVILVELLRGIADNGLIADLHGGAWRQVVADAYDTESTAPEMRDKLNTCFKIIHDRRRLVRHPAGSPFVDDDEFCWLRCAIERHHADPAYPFKGMFATEEYLILSELKEPAIVPLQQALDHNCWLDRPRSARFVKTEDQLRRNLKPLLRYAEKLVLIDPYMTCRKDRFFNTVQHCADLMGEHDGRQQPGLIHIHAGNPHTDSEVAHRESARDRLDRWEDALHPVMAQWGHRFEVFLWRSPAGGKTFHDRYLITNQCGIKAPGGLDFIDDPSKANITSWDWMEPGEIQDVILREFHQTKGPYRFLGSRPIA